MKNSSEESIIDISNLPSEKNLDDHRGLFNKDVNFKTRECLSGEDLKLEAAMCSLKTINITTRFITLLKTFLSNIGILCKDGVSCTNDWYSVCAKTKIGHKILPFDNLNDYLKFENYRYLYELIANNFKSDNNKKKSKKLKKKTLEV